MKVVGIKEYFDPVTETMETMQVISIEERDANFYKIWLTLVVQCFELIGNQKIRFVSFLLENMDNENKICMTIKQMSDKSKISNETISRTLKILKSQNFIKPINIGAYQINPDIIFKGGKDGRMNVLLQYTQLNHQASEKDNLNPKTEQSKRG